MDREGYSARCRALSPDQRVFIVDMVEDWTPFPPTVIGVVEKDLSFVGKSLQLNEDIRVRVQPVNEGVDTRPIP